MLKKLFFILGTILSVFCANTIFASTIDKAPSHVLLSGPQKSHVRISPDGKRLAYLAQNKGISNIWTKTLGKDNDYQITCCTKSINEFILAKTNKHILFVQDNNGDEKWHIYRIDLETLEIVNMTPFDAVTAKFCANSSNVPEEILILMNKNNSSYFDVYRLNVISGSMEMIEKNPGNIDIWLADNQLCVRAAVAVNTDGSTILLTRKNDNSNWQQTLAWNFEDSLAGSNPSKGSRPISFSEDGDFLYLIDSLNNNTQRLIKMNLTNGKRTLLSEDIQYDIDFAIENPITHEPEIVSYIKERRIWKSLNADTENDLKFILSINNGDLTYIERNQDDTKWVLTFENDDSSGACYLYDRQAKKIDLLFYDRPYLSSYKLPYMKPISFKTRDGLIIHGYLTCPTDKEQKNLPIVIDVHGGPWLRNTWGFNTQAQWLANQGIACLQVNFRGSTGYGKEFLNAGDKEWANKMHNDLIDAVNWVVNEKIADPKKVAIAGMSYGGYAALVGATFTPDTFCCAIDISGPSNLVTMLHSIISFNEMGKAKWLMRLGDPELDIEFLESCSPLFKADQIKIPIFIAHGGNDPRIKQSEADQMVEVMKKNGISFEYLLFPEEGHQKMSPENTFKLLMGIEFFLKENLLQDK